MDSAGIEPQPGEAVRLGPGLRRAKTIMVHLVCLGLFLVMIWQGAVFSYFVRQQISPALTLPMWLVVMVIPISGVLLACHCLLFLFLVNWSHLTCFLTKNLIN